MEIEYFGLIHRILNYGETSPGRNGNTRGVFGAQLRFDLADTESQPVIPLLTARWTYWKGIREELLWFLRGETNSRSLQAEGVHIWDGNSSREFLDSRGLTDYPEGELGPVYGKQWRRWRTADGDEKDQIAEVIRQLREDPESRRIVVSAWNVGELSQMALPPCHVMFQFRSMAPWGGEDLRRRLSCQVYQRSCDVMLGAPFNIASYGLLTHMIAGVTNHRADELVYTLGDAHIYEEHLEDARALVELPEYESPGLILTERREIDDYVSEDIQLRDYQHGPRMKMKMTV